MIWEGVLSMGVTLPTVTRLRKHEITRGNAVLRTFVCMAYEEFREQWQETEGAHERLKWARTYWQLRAGTYNKTAAEAAKRLSMLPGTYRAYERAPDASKAIKLEHQQAIFFARKFNIDWHWLLLGEGTPFDGQLSDAQAKVVEEMAQLDDAEQKRIADAVADMIAGAIKRRAAG